MLDSSVMEPMHPITRYRTAAAMTQKQLAEAAGIHEVTLSRLENRKNDATVATLVALAHALGITVGDLLEDEDAA